MSETAKVQVRGQYYWHEGRSKNISAFGYDEKVFVDVPVEWLGSALYYIQKHAINDMLRARNEKSSGFRVCEIVGSVPSVPQGVKPVDPMEEALKEPEMPEPPAVVPEPTNDFPKDAEEAETMVEEKPKRRRGRKKVN